MKKFSIILALDNENGIGKDGDLAWSIPEDMKYFKNTTTQTRDTTKQNALIMGRKTWESIPAKYRPFKNRKNFILSRKYTDSQMNSNGAYEFSSLTSCLEAVSNMNDIEQVFIIGGGQLYNEVLDHPGLEKAYITRIYRKFHCDTFFHGLPEGQFKNIYRSEMKDYKGLEYEFLIYKKKKSIIQTLGTIFKV